MKKGFLKSGFTLIELLVVISIIGVLMAVLFASFDSARKSARDSARQSDLKELQLAIELYKSQNGVYPAQGCGTPGTWAGPGPQPSWGTDCDTYILELVPEYLPSLPTDPSGEDVSGVGFMYMTNASRTVYKAMVHRSVESKFITSFADEFSRCPSVGGSCLSVGSNSDVYAVYSLGAETW
jgi:prepilin-type N-terminal cleavage/methylation domain-containing protein